MTGPIPFLLALVAAAIGVAQRQPPGVRSADHEAALLLKAAEAVGPRGDALGTSSRRPRP